MATEIEHILRLSRLKEYAWLAHRKKSTSKNTIESLSLKLDMTHGPCVDKVKSDNNFLTAPTPSENLIQKPVLERSSLAFYSRIGLI